MRHATHEITDMKRKRDYHPSISIIITYGKDASSACKKDDYFYFTPVKIYADLMSVIVHRPSHLTIELHLFVHLFKGKRSRFNFE